MYLAAYDIKEDKIRNKLSKILKDHGRRVQYSVFELNISEAELKILITRIENLIDEEEDSVRIYRICQACRKETEILGKDTIENEPADLYFI